MILTCLPVYHRISYKLSLLTWKALHTAEPSYLSELISHYAPTRTLRSLRHWRSINLLVCVRMYVCMYVCVYVCMSVISKLTQYNTTLIQLVQEH